MWGASLSYHDVSLNGMVQGHSRSICHPSILCTRIQSFEMSHRCMPLWLLLSNILLKVKTGWRNLKAFVLKNEAVPLFGFGFCNVHFRHYLWYVLFAMLYANNVSEWKINIRYIFVLNWMYMEKPQSLKNKGVFKWQILFILFSRQIRLRQQSFLYSRSATVYRHCGSHLQRDGVCHTASYSLPALGFSTTTCTCIYQSSKVPWWHISRCSKLLPSAGWKDYTVVLHNVSWPALGLL